MSASLNTPPGSLLASHALPKNRGMQLRLWAKQRNNSSRQRISASSRTVAPLYTPDQRRRRDATRWTLVQGILAPVQFLIFAISLVLVVRALATGRGVEVATGSVVVKTVALYAIMITGSVWEKVVFGRWLFAPAFFWEDVLSMLVLALHTAYIVALLTHGLQPRALLVLALAAYATYVVNAAQYVLKLRAARLGAGTSRLVAGVA